MSATTGLRTGGASRQLAVWALLAAAIVTVVIASLLVVGRPVSTVAPPAGDATKFVPGWSGWSNSSAKLHQEVNSKIARINGQGTKPRAVPVCAPCIARYQQ